jgi:hypothetical protein
MPRYFFSFRRGPSSLIDCGSLLLADETAARAEMMRIARDFMRPHAGRADPRWKGCSIGARDQRGCTELNIALAEVDPTFPQESPLYRLNSEASRADEEPSGSASVIYLSPVDLHNHPAIPEAQVVRNRALQLELRRNMLVDRLRYALLELQHQLRVARASVHQSRQLTRRSRSQRDAFCTPLGC